MIDEEICYVEAFLIDEYNVYVDFDETGMDEYWFDPDDPEDTGLISINNTNPPLTQLIILLHEAGHVIYRRKNNKLPTKVDRESIEGKMDIMYEEMMAWYEGRYLSKRLGIEIKENVWKENYCSSLLKYVKWVLSETEEN
ncbi:MAG: hypothetical protein H8E74_00700 [Gammaproteobacteria bacterium]|nr:hypothetical protein [Gammaproteobacteria bacterium]